MKRRLTAEVLAAGLFALAMAPGCEAPEKPRVEKEDVGDKRDDTKKDVGSIVPMDINPDADDVKKEPKNPLDPQVVGPNFMVFADKPEELLPGILEEPQIPAEPDPKSNPQPAVEPDAGPDAGPSVGPKPNLEGTKDKASNLAATVTKKAKDLIENLPAKFSEKLTKEEARQRLEAIKLGLDGKEFENGKYKYSVGTINDSTRGNGIILFVSVYQQGDPKQYKEEKYSTSSTGVVKMYIGIRENPDKTWSSEFTLRFPFFSTTSYTSRFSEVNDQPITQQLIEEKVQEALETLPEIRYSLDSLKAFTKEGVSVVMVKPTWRCGGCRRVAPGIIQAAKKAQCEDEKIKFTRFVVASKDEGAVAAKLGIDSFPTIIIYKDGVAITKFVGPIQNGIDAFEKPHDFGDWLVAEANKIKDAVQIADIETVEKQFNDLKEKLHKETLTINNVEYIYSAQIQKVSSREANTDGDSKDLPVKTKFLPVIKLFRKDSIKDDVATGPPVLTFEIDMFQTDPTYWSNAIFIKDSTGKVIDGLSNKKITKGLVTDLFKAHLSN